jgi:hypothetical protein
MKLTTAHLAALSPRVLEVLGQAGCVSKRAVSAAQGLRTTLLQKRGEEVEIRKSHDEQREMRSTSHAPGDIYALARDINKSNYSQREKDEMLTRPHRAEKGDLVSKLGGGRLPQQPPGSMLTSFNPPGNENFVESADAALARIARALKERDPGLTRAQALLKASSDPEFVLIHRAEQDRRMVAASKLYG